MEKVCAVCGADFVTQFSRLSVCSDSCKKEKNRQRAREWGARNPDKVSQSNKKTQQERLNNGKFRVYQEARRSSKAGYLDRFLERARKENPATDLTREYLDAIFSDKCSVTDVPFSFDRKKGTGFQNPYAPSIDRINSALPYQVGNVQIVLTAVNFAKNEMSMNDFVGVWRNITKSWAALTQGRY